MLIKEGIDLPLSAGRLKRQNGRTQTQVGHRQRVAILVTQLRAKKRLERRFAVGLSRPPLRTPMIFSSDRRMVLDRPFTPTPDPHARSPGPDQTTEHIRIILPGDHPARLDLKQMELLMVVCSTSLPERRVSSGILRLEGIQENALSLTCGVSTGARNPAFQCIDKAEPACRDTDGAD